MKAPVLLAALLVLAPLASAHGDDAEAAYDPLALDLLLHVDAAGALVETPPAAGSVAFRPGEPNAPHPPLEFTYPLPGRFLAMADAKATLVVNVERPMVLQDKDGNSFEISLAHAGEPVPGASVIVKVPPPAPGIPSAVGPIQTLTLEATLKTTGLMLNESAPLALRVRPLMPLLPPDALKLLVGGTETSLAFPLLRVPTLDDLGLQDARMDQTLATAALPRSTSTVAYLDLRVSHASVDLVAADPVAGRKAFLVLRGVESPADAHAHHEFPDRDRRAGAAHQFQVGTTLVRVHPGVAVKVPLSPGPDGLTVTVKCVLNCPEGGFERTLQLLQADDPSGATGGTLIPPPRSTKGIPVSQDAPAEDEKNLLPLATLAPLAGLAVAALARRRR
jgi:hypothetical protein